MSQKFCSACGKEGSTSSLKKCAACKCVFYCSVSCQKDHRPDHKAHCKRIKKVLEKRGSRYVERAEPLEALGEDDVPPREDCPICMLPMPGSNRTTCMTCCGKNICSACAHESKMVTYLESARENSPLDAMDFKCAFCRTPMATSEKEALNRAMKRAEMNDAQAIGTIGLQNLTGSYGLPTDKAKGEELLTRAANLGDAPSCSVLGEAYNFGLFGIMCDKLKAKTYWERAAKRGDVRARSNLGRLEMENDNILAAIKHWRIAAAAGDETSVTNLITCFEQDILRHNDLAWCLQAKDKACIEMKSEQRSEFDRYEGKETRDAQEKYWEDRVAAALAKKN